MWNMILAQVLAQATDASQGAADTAAGGATGATSNPLNSMVFMLVAFMAIMYFLMIRPQSKDRKRRDAMLAALKWVIKNPAIATTIPSMTDNDQLEENVKAMSAKFSEADQKTLTAYLDRINPLYCRMCGHCSGTCVKGLPVADTMRFLTYAEGYGQFTLARERFLELPEETRAVRCGDCTSCSVECKFGLRVAEHLGRAQELLA